MKVSAISNPIMPSRENNVNFGRKLKETEKPEYTKTIHEALDYLGVKNLSMIIHGSSFPSEKRDTSIGSPYSKGADKFVDFLKLNGFNAIQLGPGGEIGKKDNSPYIAKVFAKNQLFIDLEPLKSEEYANILSDKTYKDLTTKNEESKDKNYNYTDFDLAFSTYDKAMTEAYDTFKTKVKSRDKDALKLNKEYQAFKKENKNWVENDSLFKVLSKVNGTDDFEKWNEVDKNLPQGLKDGDKKAQERYKELKSQHKEDIGKNMFTQFIADKQMRENNNHRKEIGFNYIGDLLVGFNQSDVWANQGAFLKDWKLGCPFGGAGNGPQTWGIPVLDPKKLLNDDGSLGESGKVLKEKIAYSLKNYDNVRIDHALGLVDPYIYKEDTVVKDEHGGVRRDRLWANNVSYMHDIDPKGNFKQVLKKIVLPTFEEYGVNKNEAVWEDLCSETQTFGEVYHGQEHLPGITQTQWRRAENAPADNWTLVGSHDSEPAGKMIQNDWIKNSDAWNVEYLSGFLNPDPATGKERHEFREKIINSPQDRVKAKFTELFRSSKNLQMMFVDFFGIDKVYNYGGQDKPTNWKLRVDNDYEDDYYRALQDKNSFALNMPEILAQAVRAKSGMDVAKISYDSNKADAKRKELNTNLKPLLEKLDKFKDILKEKEPEVTETKKQEVEVSKPVVESKPAVIIEEKPTVKTEKTKPVSNEVKAEEKAPVSNPIVEEKHADSEKAEVKDKKSLDSTSTALVAAVGLAAVYKIGKAIVNKIKNLRHKNEEPQVQEVEQPHLKVKFSVQQPQQETAELQETK